MSARATKTKGAEMLESLRQLAEVGAATMVSIDLVGDVPYDRCEALLTFVRRLRDGAAFWIGDIINYADDHYGEEHAQLLEQSGLEYGTQRSYAYVARAIHPSRRVPDLSFGHHEAVAKLPPPKQTEYLALAREHRWSRDEIRRRVKAETTAEPGKPLEAPSERQVHIGLAAAVELVLEEARQVPDGDWLVPADAYAGLRRAMGIDDTKEA